MPDPMPSAGVERDAELARLILPEWPADRCRICGWTLAGSLDDGCTAESCSLRPLPSRRADDPPPYSTDPAACDSLVKDMASRGYEIQMSIVAGYWSVFVLRGVDEQYAGIHENRMDAVSGAVLLALRGKP